MGNNVDNGLDLIDSRDIIARIEELDTLVNECMECAYLETECVCDASPTMGWDDDDKAELAALLALQEEAEGSPDWQHGETLIRGSYFVEYAQQLARDLGDVSDDAGWPGRHIDWKAAADELRQDYTAVDFDGVEYLIRS